MKGKVIPLVGIRLKVDAILIMACKPNSMMSPETARTIKLKPKASKCVVTVEFPDDLYEILKEKAATIDKLSLSGSMVEISLRDRSSLLERSISLRG